MWNQTGIGVWKEGHLPPVSDELALKPSDAIARLIDPDGKRSPRTALLSPSKVTEIKGISHPVYEQKLITTTLVTNGARTRASLSSGNILDIRTLKLLTYATIDDIVSRTVPASLLPTDIALSPDEKYLFLKGDTGRGSAIPARNLILDARTGQKLLSFEGGHKGIAVSPDGKLLAIGNGQSVDIFEIY